MNGYDVSMTNPQKSQSSPVGNAICCGIAGMAAYYLPIDKNTFVDEAFDVFKKETQAKIDTLNLCADEISSKKLTNKNKVFLNNLNVAQTVGSVNAKCAELVDNITDSFKVKNIKEEFERNFQIVKKSAAARDNVVQKAISNIKWTRFGWGAAIGAVIGLATGMIKKN